MSFVQNFSTSQTSGNPSVITITDDSTGSDGAITQRRVYITDANGNYIVPKGNYTDYVQWALADSSIDIDCLLKDMAVTIVVQWLDVSNVVLYEKTEPVGFTLYNETFDYGLTQMLSGNPMLINDNNFFQDKSALRTYVDSGNQAVSLASDLFGAQSCYDEATKLRTKSQYYFNSNA